MSKIEDLNIEINCLKEILSNFEFSYKFDENHLPRQLSNY